LKTRGDENLTEDDKKGEQIAVFPIANFEFLAYAARHKKGPASSS
jgi:hypothetical protein